jgi:hypothetical protein
MKNTRIIHQRRLGFVVFGITLTIGQPGWAFRKADKIMSPGRL